MPNTLTDAPIASHTLAQDQPLMESNNLYYGNTLNVNHQIGPANGTRNDGIAKEGFHTIVQFVNQGGNPGAIAGTGQLYTKTVGSDQALFYESGGGVVAQLTTNIAPFINLLYGYTFLAGGIIMQWGAVVTPGSSGTVMFAMNNIAFPNNLFNVQLTLFRPDTSGGSGIAVVDSAATFDKTTFSYVCSTAGSVSLLWYAIGN